MITEYVTYETALAMKRKGFAEYTSQCIVKYDEDFIYDEDINHPESHRKGDIRVYEYNHRNEEDDNAVSLPSIDEAVNWLREKGYHISFEPSYDRNTDEVLYYAYVLESNGKKTYVINEPMYYESCSERAVDIVVNMLKDDYPYSFEYKKYL